jgi:predicted Zn-dependent protease
MLAIGLALILAGHAGAADLPDLGESARASLSEVEEERVGREAMRKIRQHRDFVTDPEITAYLNALGERLAASSAKPYLQFEFFAVRDPSINAFALPGGFIGVHTGLLSAVRSESELAGVIAHEIAHVTQNHIARLVDSQRGSGLTTLAALAVAILAARSNPEVAQAAVTTAQALSVQSQLDFTRENEKEADRVGFQNLDSAGFDPTGMASFFERLMHQTRFQDSSAPTYLRTHPLSHERMADMQNRAANTPYRQHQDSLEFTLLRAKVMAEEGDAQEALRRFSAFSRERPGDVGAGYGLVHASLRAGEAQQAAALFARLAGKLESPLLQTLGARIDEALGNSTAAIERLRQAQLRHTADKPLTYAYVESLLRARRVREALVQIQAGLLNWPEDARLLALLAEARFAVGQPMEGHLAMAESHLSNDLPSAAMEQLQLAQKASGGDFYTRSIVESRLRELRLREQKDTKR